MISPAFLRAAVRIPVGDVVNRWLTAAGDYFVTSDGDRWVYAGPELPPDLDDAGLSFGSSTFGSSTFGS